MGKWVFILGAIRVRYLLMSPPESPSCTEMKPRQSTRAPGGWFRKRKYRLLSYLFPRYFLFKTPAKPYHRVVAGLAEGYFGDLGCGVGACAAMYSVRSGQRSCGMDLTKSSLAYGRREARRFRIPLNFVVGSVLEPPFSDSKFDTVYLGQVIEHIHEDKAVVKEAVRILKPGGKLVISVPIGHGCMPPEGIEGGHVNFYETEEDCVRLLSGLPLQDVQFHAGDSGRYIFSSRSSKRA